MGQRMVGLYYLSRCALSQRTQLPNTASLIVCGMPVALPYLRSPFTPRHGVGRSANAVEGSAPIGAGARAVNLDGARFVSFVSHSTRLGGRMTEVGE